MEIPVMVIVVRAIFYDNNKYYPQLFLDECLYEIYKELMLIKQVHQNSAMLVTIGIS